jgi:hypothetical protein
VPTPPAPDDAEAAGRGALGLVVGRLGQAAWLGAVVLLLWGLARPAAAWDRAR